MLRRYGLTAIYVVIATIGLASLQQGISEAKPGHRAGKDADAGAVALQYAQALASGNRQVWAALDLGCLSRLRRAPVQTGEARVQHADRCYADTLQAHRALLEQEGEPGILGPNGRGRGFGLISDVQRPGDLRIVLPPAVFLSPAVIQTTQGTTPVVKLRTVFPSRPIALQEGAETPRTVRGTMVELSVSYPDPFTAPLALAPSEVRWANGTARRYQPVHSVVIRLVVAGDLRAAGYEAHQAVINEALAASPRISATSYGLDATDEALQPKIRGSFVRDATTWWTRELAGPRYSDAVHRAERTGDPAIQRTLLASLLLLDPSDPVVNARLGSLEYDAFLRSGLVKGHIEVKEDPTWSQAAELYWNLQAQTWRQELTEVAVGHSSAAEAFYAAIRSLELAATDDQAAPEVRRRLGVLHRWNNNAQEALTLHEALLRGVSDTEAAAAGPLLADIAWDRIQWISWERRYDHPWLEQAQREAAQALGLARTPMERLIAAQALMVSEALSTRRTAEGLDGHLAALKDSYRQLNGVQGLWSHLVGNDVVKALISDGEGVSLPMPARSSEVLDVAIHAEVPLQDIVWQWDFDQDTPQRIPAGFQPLSTSAADPSGWRVVPHGNDIGTGQLLMHEQRCLSDDCTHLLVASHIRPRYPDITVQVHDLATDSEGEAGILLAVRDSRNYYAVTLNTASGTVTTRRTVDGRTTVVGRTTVTLAKRPWHTLRVQRINFIHLDRGRLGVFVDGAQVPAVIDEVVPEGGQIGLITIGSSPAQFDGLHVLDLVSNRPLSDRAAY